MCGRQKWFYLFFKKKNYTHIRSRYNNIILIINGYSFFRTVNAKFVLLIIEIFVSLK